jgi:hypothetical protein
MESPDGGGLSQPQPVYIASVIVEADPDLIRVAYGMMIDAVLEQSAEAGTILDWGSLETTSLRAVDADTGVEYIQFGMGVRAIGL